MVMMITMVTIFTSFQMNLLIVSRGTGELHNRKGQVPVLMASRLGVMGTEIYTKRYLHPRFTTADRFSSFPLDLTNTGEDNSPGPNILNRIQAAIEHIFKLNSDLSNQQRT